MIKNCISASLPSKFGDFKIAIHKDKDKKDHIVLIKGDFNNKNKSENILVRIHSECITGDLFGSLRCDCGEQMQKSLKMIEKKGRGIFIYLRQEGRGIGIENKLKAYNLQDAGYDTIEANKKLGFPSDMRNFEIAGKILKKLGVISIELISNNPNKIKGNHSLTTKLASSRGTIPL